MELELLFQYILTSYFLFAFREHLQFHACRTAHKRDQLGYPDSWLNQFTKDFARPLQEAQLF